MAKITRPNENIGASNVQISPGAISQLTSGTTALGRTISNVGRAFQQNNTAGLARQVGNLVAAEGSKYFNETKKAHQTAQLSTRMADATKDYIAAKKQRMAQPVDEQGNPTFTELDSDLSNIGDTILKGYSKQIKDPEVAKEFVDKFNSYVSNQRLGAMEVARQQQIDYSRSSLDKGLNGLVEQGVSDDLSNIKSYENEAISLLQSSLESGAITEEEYNAKLQGFVNNIRTSSYSKVVSEDSVKAGELLTLSAEQLGITEETKQELSQQLEAKVKTDAIELEKAKQIQEIDDKANRAGLAEEISKRIEADLMREDELISMSKHLDDKTYKDLKKKLIRESEKRSKSRTKLLDVSSRIAANDNIEDLTSGDVNKYFNYVLEQRQQVTGAKASLLDQAEAAAHIPLPVSDYGQRLESHIKSGSTENAKDTLEAYSYIKTRNKPTIDSGFDSEATKIAEHATLLVERGGLSPQRALQSAREAVLEKNDPKRSQLITEFNDFDEFKDKNIRQTVTQSLELEGGFFTSDVPVSADAITTYKRLVEDAYTTHGDLEAAKNFATTQLNKNYGVSEINGTSEYMFKPPEKVFPTIPPETIRNILIDDIEGNIPEGVDKSTVRIASDSMTAGEVTVTGFNKYGEKVTRPLHTWTVEYETEIDGLRVRVPVIDERTGSPKRWTPVGSNYVERTKQEDINESKKAAEEFRAAEEARIADPYADIRGAARATNIPGFDLGDDE